MALPTIPRKEHIFKSKYYPKGKITLVPYTTGEEALLLQVKDSKDELEILKGISQVLGLCMKEKNEADELPMFVVEDLYLRLRSISVSDIIPLRYRCKNKVDKFFEKSTNKIMATKSKTTEVRNVDCNGEIPVKLILDDFKLVEDEGHKNTFMITDTIGVKMKYPTIESFFNYYEASKNESPNDVFMMSLDSIFDGDQVWYASDTSKEELNSFFDSIIPSVKAEIKDNFILKMPHLYNKIQTKCPCCGREEEIEFNKLADIFA